MIEPGEREQLLRIYAETRTIAVVGASSDVSKAAHQVPLYLGLGKDSFLRQPYEPVEHKILLL